MNFQFRSLERWPGEPTAQREQSRFRAQHSDTLDLLDRELWFLKAENIVLQVDVPESQIRLDGMLRANATPREPGVILSFDSINGPLSFPCDRFATWKENLRAIALALEALRKVDRYGVTSNAEQYRGWKRLGSDTSTRYEWDSETEARGFIYRMADVGPDAVFHYAWKAAAQKYHPDRNPEGETTFKMLASARQYLKEMGAI
ncbi:J domain-containing protein [bacterium]|nr:J domain-containing protein [bacterium]